MSPEIIKKIKVLVLVNTLQSVASYVYGNHIAFFSWIAKNRPDIDLIFYTPQRMTIDTARTMAAKQALQDECDYLMFLDDDVLVPVDALDKLLKAQKHIIAGLVIIRGFPFNVMAFKHAMNAENKPYLGFFNDLAFEDDERKKLVELQACDAVGFSCCLINCDMLKAIEPPYFVTGPHNTEDVYFCLKAQKTVLDENNNPPSIYLHAGVQCGHMMPAEAVEWETRHQYYNLYAPYAELTKTNIKVRAREYLDRALAALGNK